MEKKFLGVFELLEESFQILKARLGQLVLINLASMISVLLLFFLGALLASIFGITNLFTDKIPITDKIPSFPSLSLIPTLVLVIGFLAILIFSIIITLKSSMALIEEISAKEKISVKEAFRKTNGRVFAYWGVMILTFVGVLGASLIFLIPGIILGIFLIFSGLIYVKENEKGMKALVLSREYIRGHFWGVVGRLTVFSLLLSAFNLLVGSLYVIPGAGPIMAVMLRLFIGLVLPAFSAIYYYLIYKNLKAIRSSLKEEDRKQSKTFLTVAVALGFVFLSSIVFLAGFLLPLALKTLPYWEQKIEMPEYTGGVQALPTYPASEKFY